MGGNKIKLSNKENPRYFDIEANEYDYKERIIGKVISFIQNII